MGVSGPLPALFEHKTKFPKALLDSERAGDRKSIIVWSKCRPTGFEIKYARTAAALRTTDFRSFCDHRKRSLRGCRWHIHELFVGTT